MDHGHFDGLTRTIAAETPTRRATLRLVAGAALGGLAARLGVREPATAKHKRKKKKTHLCGGAYPVQCPPPSDDPTATCFPTGTHCCSSAVGGGACSIGNDCCPPSVTYPGGSCAAADEVCCSAAAGGGSCAKSSPVCCPPSLLEPEGSCVPRGATCCPYGGYCDAGEDCCPPSAGFPYGSCAPAGTCFALTAAHDGSHGTPVRKGDTASRSGHRHPAADGQGEHGRP